MKLFSPKEFKATALGEYPDGVPLRKDQRPVVQKGVN